MLRTVNLCSSSTFLRSSQLLTMWGASLIFFTYVATQVASREIKVECREYRGNPPFSDDTPSTLVDLRVQQVTVGGGAKMNISWVINIDSSNKYLIGTRIRIDGDTPYHCTYNPNLAELNLTEQTRSFHYLVNASYGFNSIQAANIPLPYNVNPYKLTTMLITTTKKPVTPSPTTVPIVETTSLDWRPKDEHAMVNFSSKAVAIFGGLAGLMILIIFYIIYKSCGVSVATSLGFRRLPSSAMGPVSVLVVYPAANSDFQSSVVALAEFLQWHGGCSVSVDMWQQRKIAELGPMRWLAEKAKTAHRVLIVCPQPSLQSSHSAPNHTLQEHSIPAAAHDLYPLILNMVASHAKSASDLAKFWVVQLGEKPNNLALELRACKTFCLMKDLNKLCRSLHTNQDDKKISDLIFRPEIAYSEDCTVKLREAVEKLGRHQPSILREVEPLNSVLTVV